MRIFSEHKELRSIDWILLPYGTGTTALGITAALQELGAAIKVMGISVSRTKERCLKAAEEFLSIGDLGNLLIDDRFAGKYGQRTTDQDNYFAQFLKETGIMVDPIYNIRSVQYFYDENLSNGLIINTGGTGNLFL
jgi:1-aminocyclopropane-1-carboxylate deaminase/D-cysteine desulfhydrase-like pyridoxal-dependent ACC family enzyme